MTSSQRSQRQAWGRSERAAGADSELGGISPTDQRPGLSNACYMRRSGGAGRKGKGPPKRALVVTECGYYLPQLTVVVTPRYVTVFGVLTVRYAATCGDTLSV